MRYNPVVESCILNMFCFYIVLIPARLCVLFLIVNFTNVLLHVVLVPAKGYACLFGFVSTRTGSSFIMFPRLLSTSKRQTRHPRCGPSRRGRVSNALENVFLRQHHVCLPPPSRCRATHRIAMNHVRLPYQKG